MSLTSTHFGYRVKRAAACLAVVAASGGCARTLSRWNPNGWLGDFDTAEQRVTESDKELLIVYKGGNLGRKSSLRKAFDAEPLAAKVKDKVCCVLSRSYEPDRRYVAQYGVHRAPALILIHRDGTYHARTGPMTPDAIKAFLASAKPPGAAAVYDPHIARHAHYHWQRAMEPALAQATREKKPLLVVYYRKLSRDWWRLKKLLNRHEVCCRLDNAIPCRVAVHGFSREQADTPFGTLRLPALVIVKPDGKHDVLEMPTSYETVALFADRTLNENAQRIATSSPTQRGAEAANP